MTCKYLPLAGFPERFRSARKAARLSQTQVAKLLSVTPRQVSKWERGRAFPLIPTARRIATVLPLPFEEIYLAPRREDMRTIGERLRFSRKAADMRQGDLADKVHLSIGSITHFETGRTIPSPRHLPHLAKALGVSLKFLRGEEDE